MRLHMLGLLAVTALSLAACAQAGAPATTAPSMPAAASALAAPTASPLPTPVPTLLNPAPPEMLGKWMTEFAEGDIGTITISPTGIRIKRFASADVRLEVFGDELVLSHSQLCTGEGRYRWSIEGDELRFDSIEPDACDGRAKTFNGVTFTRVPA
ncbi:MAG TPA: hypothetical protein VFP56_09730 [Candidatus Limnocylindrales bacterium]|nr:hypothetical protein [Candidatus Limnocylindrales bacterium]